MPTNNFKLFDEKKANMMSDEDYAINQQRLNGVQSGVASSQLQNKTLYQTALMCYALAQLMAANGYDANDANAVSTFVNNLSASLVQKVVDKASANDVANKVAGKWVDAKQLGELKTDVADNYLPLLGGTMLGDLTLHGDPVSSLQAATKQYVDKMPIGVIKGRTILHNISYQADTYILENFVDANKYKALILIYNSVFSNSQQLNYFFANGSNISHYNNGSYYESSVVLFSSLFSETNGNEVGTSTIFLGNKPMFIDNNTIKFSEIKNIQFRNGGDILTFDYEILGIK